MDEILPHFFKHFWNHRMALDRRNYRQLVDTTVEIANKVSIVNVKFTFPSYISVEFRILVTSDLKLLKGEESTIDRL